jgi:hypothetical protein
VVEDIILPGVDVLPFFASSLLCRHGISPTRCTCKGNATARDGFRSPAPSLADHYNFILRTLDCIPHHAYHGSLNLHTLMYVLVHTFCASSSIASFFVGETRTHIRARLLFTELHVSDESSRHEETRYLASRLSLERQSGRYDNGEARRAIKVGRST